ncbi:hypothetical protein M422DRAFT_22905 [Sphaerobolus stellatus SS14]|nr:hypothetical protein M422DRAFT_22905 [Sphaerobolus stellatus SS14]
MSITTIQVHLPAYSHSFNVSVPSESTIHAFKDAISKACTGEPQVSGQRVIYRGRVLGDAECVRDIWKNEEGPHVCHLAVHPSAWKSAPPNNNPPPTNSTSFNNLFQQPQQHQQPQQRMFAQPEQPYFAPTPTQPQGPSITAVPRTTYLYIQYMHTNALRILAHQDRIPWPQRYGSMEDARAFAKRGVESSGRGWPSFLNDDIPGPTPEDANEGVRYRSSYVNNLPCLTLQTPDATPTPLQSHAIRVLSYTFPLLCVNSTEQAQQPSNLLQVNPLAPRPIAPFAVRPQALFNQIPLRPLILPVIMLFIRTSLLLYFFQPARKPLMAFMVLIWVIWELATAVRGVFGEENGRNNARGAGENPAGQGAAANNGAMDNNAPPNAAAPQGAQQGQRQGANNNNNNNGVRPVLPNTQDAIMNRLSQFNIQEEAALVEPEATPNPSTPRPSLFHKVGSFFVLLGLTLHPAIWDRRRATLRQREVRIRDEARTREARIQQRERERAEREENRRKGLEVTEEAETEIPRIAPKPFWVVEYVQRVRSGDWVDDT